jgi:hypothetical protein
VSSSRGAVKLLHDQLAGGHRVHLFLVRPPSSRSMSSPADVHPGNFQGIFALAGGAVRIELTVSASPGRRDGAASRRKGCVGKRNVAQ